MKKSEITQLVESKFEGNINDALAWLFLSKMTNELENVYQYFPILYIQGKEKHQLANLLKSYNKNIVIYEKLTEHSNRDIGTIKTTYDFGCIKYVGDDGLPKTKKLNQPTIIMSDNPIIEQTILRRCKIINLQ